MSQPFIVSEAAPPTKIGGIGTYAACPVGRPTSRPSARPSSRPFVRLLRRLAIAAVSLTSLSAAALDGPQSLPVIQLGAGMYNIKAEVARTPQEHAIGLMHRSSMPVNHGMLFVFDRPERQCFWMKNTLIPLSIAFLRDDGTVVNVAEMKAGSLDSHCSAEPVRFALEMNQGWFSRRGVKPGDRLAGAPFGTPR
ncbi:DUF192 domain-containing protein [Aquabacterium fontiphilum]|jgi:uncharacterized membrane protein (UPF0127 family)|nr:DUF192 domain-containing protein [Aquabacterium fontiphilum]